MNEFTINEEYLKKLTINIFERYILFIVYKNVPIYFFFYEILRINK